MKFRVTFLALLITGCSNSVGSLPPEVAVNSLGRTKNGTHISEILRCETPGTMIICKTFGAQKYCSCGYPSAVMR